MPPSAYLKAPPSNTTRHTPIPVLRDWNCKGEAMQERALRVRTDPLPGFLQNSAAGSLVGIVPLCCPPPLPGPPSPADHVLCIPHTRACRSALDTSGGIVDSSQLVQLKASSPRACSIPNIHPLRHRSSIARRLHSRPRLGARVAADDGNAGNWLRRANCGDVNVRRSVRQSNVHRHPRQPHRTRAAPDCANGVRCMKGLG